MGFLQNYRQASLDNIKNINSFSNSWVRWKTSIETILNNDVDANSVINLGDSLREIFFSTNSNTRDQSGLSGGGAAWETLICWYLNLCLCNSRTVVVKFKNELVPEVVRDALAVSYGNSRTNTESDLVALSFPEDIDNLTGDYSLKKLNKICETYIDKIGLCNIQCKTNWNDNAQIPMLWDIVYQTTEFATHNISVGANNRKLTHFRKFRYCFVTVPSQKNIERSYKPDSTSVKRVKNISGGNYWGLPSKEGVAMSIKEMLSRIFDDSSISSSIRIDLQNAIDSNEHQKYLA